MKKCIKMSVLGAAFAVALVGSVCASTVGAFTGSLTNAFLSVDINGGQISAGGCTTEGTGSADPYGVTWSPWGGPVSTSGDGTQLPNNSASVTGTSISKTFGSVTATISLDSVNQAAYANPFTINSRDRSALNGAANDGDMFRDFVFAATGGGIQGENYIALQLSGLTSGAAYTVAVYSFDQQSSLIMNWTATAPTLYSGNGRDGWWGSTPNGSFAAPADEQTINWSSGTTTMRAPAVFTVNADNAGVIKLYGFGGDGISNHNSSTSSYLNGFQIAGGGSPTNTLTFLPVADTNINAGMYLTITNVVLTNGVVVHF
jgi:hypothetical protein